MNNTFFITSKNGKLVVNGEFVKPKLFQPTEPYDDGDLSTEASHENILSACESILELFIRPQGVKLDQDKKWRGYISMDVVKKFSDGSRPPKRSKSNLTRGWCYLASGVLHRLFFKYFDLYAVKCPLAIKGDKDKHWWIESKFARNKYVIDLTEEQYLIAGIKNVRDGGKKCGGMGHSYGMKTRNMAFLVASHRFPNVVNLDLIKHTGYVKKYPELITSLKGDLTEEDLLIHQGFIETKHAKIRQIKFYVGKHLRNEDYHLEKELTHYWKSVQRFIDFDPKESLLNPIKLIEKKSDEMFNKSDYFVIEKLVLSSSQTDQKEITDVFIRTISHQIGHEPLEFKFDQTIKVKNGIHSKNSRSDHEVISHLEVIEDCYDEIDLLSKKLSETFDKLDANLKERNERNLLNRVKQKLRQKNNSVFADWKYATGKDERDLAKEKLKEKQRIQDEIDEKLYQDTYGKSLETQEDIMKFFEEKPDSKFNDDEWNPDKFLFG
jgi:hypothetical protein|tara:strand:- start:562 stop:2040 length:1479 start_codon:yes stop_codon:yes gene_type:complete